MAYQGGMPGIGGDGSYVPPHLRGGAPPPPPGIVGGYGGPPPQFDGGYGGRGGGFPGGGRGGYGGGPPRQQGRGYGGRGFGGGGGGGGRGYGAGSERAEADPFAADEKLKAEADTIFGAENTGINFDAYDDIPVETSGQNIPPCIEHFEDYANELTESVMNNIRRCKYTKPTPVQKHAIPIGLSGRDMMACAQTGSGKTAAFCFPIIASLLKLGVPLSIRSRKACPYALVLSPTRELSSQIYDEARKFCYQTGIRPVVIYGGAAVVNQVSAAGGPPPPAAAHRPRTHLGPAGGLVAAAACASKAAAGVAGAGPRRASKSGSPAMAWPPACRAWGQGPRPACPVPSPPPPRPRPQLRELERGCDFLVATPGRLSDLIERARVSLANIKCLALDEVRRALPRPQPPAPSPSLLHERCPWPCAPPSPPPPCPSPPAPATRRPPRSCAAPHPPPPPAPAQADRMLDMGFEPQIRRIVEQEDMPPTGQRQTLLFSATFPKEIQRLASDFLSNHIFLTVGRVGSSTDLIVQHVEYVQPDAKRETVIDLINSVEVGRLRCPGGTGGGQGRGWRRAPASGTARSAALAGASGAGSRVQAGAGRCRQVSVQQQPHPLAAPPPHPPPCRA
jgi:hypothetical protein